MVEKVISSTKLCMLKFPLSDSPAQSLWAREFTSLSLSFFICKMEIIIILSLEAVSSLTYVKFLGS